MRQFVTLGVVSVAFLYSTTAQETLEPQGAEESQTGVDDSIN